MIVAVDSSQRTFPLPLVAGAALTGGLLLRHAWRRAPQDPPVDREDDVVRDPPDGREGDALALGADASLPRATTTSADVTPPSGRWVFPIPRWQGRAPVISDGWGSPRDGGVRRHRGADLMYRRRTRRELELVFPPRAPHSRWHFMPAGTLALAAGDADVWFAGRTTRGHAIVLSHGAPWATFYTHLEHLYVRPTARGASRERVRAGQPIGLVGADPTDARAIAHLHFETWYRGGAEAAIDPAPLLRRWEVVDPPAPPTAREVS